MPNALNHLDLRGPEGEREDLTVLFTDDDLLEEAPRLVDTLPTEALAAA